jgi:hypothetical protein
MTFADLLGRSSHPWNEITVHWNGNISADGIGYDFSGPPRPSGQITLVRPDGKRRLRPRLPERNADQP